MLLKPKLTYRGLTIVMSNGSRFDRAELLSATGGWYFRNECVRPHLNIMQCEVRTKDEKSPFLPNTKAILLLGKEAYVQYTGDTEHTLGEVRGSIYYVNGIPAIPSYLPQDCMDVKDYESAHNDLLQGKDYDEPGDAAVSSAKSEKRRHGVTSRSNWRFWLFHDTQKAIRILLNEGVVPSPNFTPTYRLQPPAAEVIRELETYTGGQLYLDIETDEQLHVKCIGYSCDSNVISIVPFLDHTYRPAYSEMAQIYRAFSLALLRNTVISHNGASFDWPVLTWKYKMFPPGKCYDTMLAQHRCYPDIEKSLGHCTSLWTYEPFHKDEGSASYHTFEQARQLWQYCGKDVYTMMLIRRAIDAHAAKTKGLAASIAQVNESIPAYILMTLHGIRYKQELLDKIMEHNDLAMNQYNRLINLLVGPSTVTLLNRTSKKSIASSNTKSIVYFHSLLGYPVVAKSKVTGKPSLAKKAMFKLRIKQPNPVIDLIIKYRFTAHESGMLKFNPWKT